MVKSPEIITRKNSRKVRVYRNAEAKKVLDSGPIKVEDFEIEPGEAIELPIYIIERLERISYNLPVARPMADGEQRLAEFGSNTKIPNTFRTVKKYIIHSA